MRIRCQQCGRKISVDEAFAGGVCRCPYCKAIVYVPGGETQAAGQRPAAPAPIRPLSPAEAPAEQPSKAIPTARPVQAPAVKAIVILVALAVLLGLAVMLVVKNLRPDAPPSPEAIPTDGAAPVETDGPNVLGVALDEPVLYCLDASGSMRETFDYALAAVRHSVRTLPASARLNVMVWTEAGPRTMSPSWVTADEQADRRVAQFLDGIRPVGRTDERAGLLAAVDLAPRTLAVLATKALERTDGVASAAKAKGVTIHAATIGGHEQAHKAAADLAAETGGQARPWMLGELDAWLSRQEALP